MTELQGIFEEILTNIGNGDYDNAEILLKEFHAGMETAQVHRKDYEPEIGIVESSLLMTRMKFTEAKTVIEHSLKIDPNNYELYYAYAMCLEQLGSVEQAYFAYKLAIYFGKDSSDHNILEQGFQNLCSYANANEYELGKACERMIMHRIAEGEYEMTFRFLSAQIYDTNRYAANIVLTEENMLLHMMLEIVLCEQRNMEKKQYESDNIIKRCNCDVYAFKSVYKEIKLMVRRIRFGLSIDEQKELNVVMKRLGVSVDVLAVIAKYTVTQDYWVDLFKRMQAIVQYAHPFIGQGLLRYIMWMEQNQIGTKSQCIAPYERIEELTVKKLKYTKEKRSAIAGKDDKKISIIYCTNDELYANECNRYIKHLNVPQGFTLEILEIWNAPGMAAGYNYAMQHTDAQYKIYIHQDTFIIKRDALLDVVDRFQRTDYKMLGIAGTKCLPEDGYWHHSKKEDMRMQLYQDIVLDILQSKSIVCEGSEEQAEALDGIFLATCEDIPWREDLFDHWHFYDISQCFEFRRNHFMAAVMNDDAYLVMHETTAKKDAHKSYEKYCDIFLKEYQGDMRVFSEHISGGNG